MPRKPTNPVLRLLGKIEMVDSCWVYQGNSRYSTISHNGKTRTGHRVIYEELVGEIPDGMTIDHLCRNKRCVNPEHLEIVTMRENTLRGVGPTAKNAEKTHCLYGHPYEGENLHIRPGGGRRCRECARIEARRRYAAKKVKL